MPQMPAPMMTELTASRRRDRSRRLEIASANKEVSIPMSRDARLISMLYRSGIATEKASMPMKCIDQMPMPIEAAPPSSQSIPARRSAPATRSVSLSAVYETRIATMTERCTSHGLYVACIHGKLPEMPGGVQCARSQLPADDCDAVDVGPRRSARSRAGTWACTCRRRAAESHYARVLGSVRGGSRIAQRIAPCPQNEIGDEHHGEREQADFQLLAQGSRESHGEEDRAHAGDCDITQPWEEPHGEGRRRDAGALARPAQSHLRDGDDHVNEYHERAPAGEEEG